MTHRLKTGSYAFFIQLYQIVNDRSLDAIISWSKNNDNSFVIWDVDEFCIKVLSNSVELGRSFEEFVSELRSHRFISFGRFEFGHENLVRGRPQLLKRMSKARNENFAEKMKAKKDKYKAKKARAKVARLLQNLQI